ncbi:MAG: hypothetical protein K2W99_02215 [Chthoniobacterales bacterium]|nr:hypothetical protein [Chthoniobacterales bacterium]
MMNFNLSKANSASDPGTILQEENFNDLSPKKTGAHFSKIEEVSSKERPITPLTESESRSGGSSPIVRSWTGTSSQSSDDIKASEDPTSASHYSFLDTLRAEAKLTQEDLGKTTYYIRYDSRAGLFLDHNPSTKTDYRIKRNETKMVAKTLVESCRNQYGDALGDILEKRLQAKFGRLSSSMVTFQDLSPVTETAQFYQEVLQAPLKSDNSSSNTKISPENISLKEHQAVLYKQEGMDGAPQPDIVILPRHYVYSATPEELSAIETQKTGFVDLQEKQLQKINTSSEEEVLQALLHGKEWPRVQIQINDKLLPYNSDGAIDLPTFKKEIKTLLNKEPSSFELIQILTMLNREGRVAGLSKGGQTGKVLLTETYTPPSADKTQNETVTLSYENGKVVCNYQSQVSKLGSLNVTTTSGSVGYSLRTANNTDRPADLYKMQRMYKATLQLAENRSDAASDLKQRVHLEESRQMFFLSKS